MQELIFEQYPINCDYSDDQCFFFSYDTPSSDYSDEFGMIQDYSCSEEIAVPIPNNSLSEQPTPQPVTQPHMDPMPCQQLQCSIQHVQFQPVSNNQLEMKLLLSVPQGSPYSNANLSVPVMPMVQTPCMPTAPAEKFTLINLSSTYCEPNFVAQMQSLPVDVSANLSEFHYNKLYKEYRDRLLLPTHPMMSEHDLDLIKAHGRVYFLKNVKMIAPKIGPWKFNCHTPKGTGSNDRQFNIPGLAITCRVKEWLDDDGALWRMYHFKEGKVKRKVVRA